jgi:two-component system, sensor histidine kinase and response regulator
MRSYEQTQSLQEQRYENPGNNLELMTEAAQITESMKQETLATLQRSKESLRSRAAALQSRNLELEAYAQMVAHDLKDPLTIMVIISDLVNEVPDLTPRELKDSLLQIKTTAYEMQRIIDNLLLFAEVSKAEAPLEPVDMAQVLASVQERLGRLILERQAQVILPRAWPEAIGYAPWIEEVWANYISNAIKYGGQPPRMELDAAVQPDGMIRFWVEDNGPGVPEDARTHIFTPLHKIDRIRKPGHGVGLSIVFQIVEKLGGQVGVESKPGGGSLFFFTLPGIQRFTPPYFKPSQVTEAKNSPGNMM